MTENWGDARARKTLRRIFGAAVASAAPGPAVLRHLPDKPVGRCIVVGAGKASAAMAAALEAAWPDVDLTGVVVTRYGHSVPAGRIEILEASHPTPDAMSEIAARRILAAVANLRPIDLVIALISGGGSSLMALPAGAMTLADKQAINKALLASGATIAEMNAVRKQFSLIKGGRLAAAAFPARVVTLAISDVPGDDPAVIASGPTVMGSSNADEALAILTRAAITLPASAQAVLAARAAAPAEANAMREDIRIIAAPFMALKAAARAAQDCGATPVILGDALEGESRELGIFMAGIARSVRTHGLPAKAPTVLLSGGETTVSIGAGPAGRGGRNTEFLLSLAQSLRGEVGVWAVAGDTDGIDGTEDAAGAFVAPDSLARAHAMGLDTRALLAGHDSYTFFDRLGDLIRTGPTLTNVNDIRAILIA